MSADLHAVPDTSSMDLKQKQAAYHDWESRSYDTKFSISYDQRCIDYAAARFDKGIDTPVDGRTLEIGGGTGFFLVNLALAKRITGELVISDISPGMLEVAQRNANEHDVEVETAIADAEALPFPDNHFDLVIGHAFLHHLPLPGKALMEVQRVLKPGGRILIAGEPTRLGDKISWVVKQNTWRAFRAVTALPAMDRYRATDLKDGGASAQDTLMARLEDEVDLHTFRPGDIEHMAKIAGFEDVDVQTEELVANWAGWAVRTIEGSIAEGTLGMRWAMGAFKSYLTLTRFDEAVMRKVVPKALFYNLILTATKPGS
jgi:ubiquinone/menaquinone biosynthesis C-methylase UbiE